jgi:predicted dehydrogenase
MRTKTEKKIRYAVVGLGYISQIAVLPAFRDAQSNSTLTALVSGDPAKLRAISKKYGITSTYSYEQYADSLASGEVEAVYIGLPITCTAPTQKQPPAQEYRSCARNLWR